MTVGELKAKLAEYPDDAVVILQDAETEDWTDPETVEQLDLVKFRVDIHPPHPWTGRPIRHWHYLPASFNWDREPYLGKFDRLTGVCIR